MHPTLEETTNHLSRVTCLFLDIGGVVLSDGWARGSRALAATKFELDLTELNERHQEVFANFELDVLSLKEYLELVVFYKPRPFNHEQFWSFMCAQSRPYDDMIQLVSELKAEHNLKVVVVSNEAREINAYRIREFRLTQFVDAFVSSCFVHMRKPNEDMLRLAMDIAQVRPNEVAYIDNTALFVDIAEKMEIPSILHTDCDSTRRRLAALGLSATKEEGKSAIRNS